jgi:hypothetical protein
MNNAGIFDLIWLYFDFKKIVFESSVLAWIRIRNWIRIRIEQKCWIRISIESIRIHNPEFLSLNLTYCREQLLEVSLLIITGLVPV